MVIILNTQLSVRTGLQTLKTDAFSILVKNIHMILYLQTKTLIIGSKNVHMILCSQTKTLIMLILSTIR